MADPRGLPDASDDPDGVDDEPGVDLLFAPARWKRTERFRR